MLEEAYFPAFLFLSWATVLFSVPDAKVLTVIRWLSPVPSRVSKSDCSSYLLIGTTAAGLWSFKTMCFFPSWNPGIIIEALWEAISIHPAKEVALRILSSITCFINFFPFAELFLTTHTYAHSLDPVSLQNPCLPYFPPCFSSTHIAWTLVPTIPSKALARASPCDMVDHSLSETHTSLGFWDTILS